jgi:bifunctional non-homologous end joining protein LigD
MHAFIEPMNATLATHPFDSPDWLFEVKWDGYRVEAIVQDGTVRMLTRRGNDAARYFPGLLSPPTWINAESAIVDGEVVALDEEGVPRFELLQQRISGVTEVASAPVVYMAFDLLYLDGRSLLRVPLEDRKRLLKSVLRAQPRVQFASHIEGEGKTFFEVAKQRELEGLIAKKRGSIYEPGRRVTTWLKLKVRPEQELVVGGYIPGEGSAKDLGALLVGTYEGDKLRYGGRVGSGLNSRTRATLKARMDELARPTAPFDPPPPRTGELRYAHYAEPQIVIRAEFADWTREGTIRQSAFKGILDGRDPRSVTREKPIDPPVEDTRVDPPAGADDAPPRKPTAARTPATRDGDPAKPQAATREELDALARMSQEGLWHVGGRELKLTNLDKVLFPPKPDTDETPITKRELIAYFGRIGPVLLPHLAERPLNLNRFPNGVGGPNFWQKDIPAHAPAWLRRWVESEAWQGGEHRDHAVGPEHRKPNTHLVADEVATLCWLGNQASFEFHAWTSRLDAPDRPTYALIDIDPGERTTWEETLTLARLFRTALGHLHVRAVPKLTGKRGVQIWIPIVTRYSFHETSDWVEGVSRAVGSMVPDLVSWEWSKSDRKGRARLDFTQNQPIKTLVAPYAVRPLPGAPVSAPIAWDELDDPELRPDRWTIRSILTRIAERGDLFAGVLTDPQELPPLS